MNIITHQSRRGRKGQNEKKILEGATTKQSNQNTKKNGHKKEVQRQAIQSRKT